MPGGGKSDQLSVTLAVIRLVHSQKPCKLHLSDIVCALVCVSLCAAGGPARGFDLRPAERRSLAVARDRVQRALADSLPAIRRTGVLKRQVCYEGLQAPVQHSQDMRLSTAVQHAACLSVALYVASVCPTHWFWSPTWLVNCSVLA
jgi:hypothetical protein